MNNRLLSASSPRWRTGASWLIRPFLPTIALQRLPWARACSAVRRLPPFRRYNRPDLCEKLLHKYAWFARASYSGRWFLFLSGLSLLRWFLFFRSTFLVIVVESTSCWINYPGANATILLLVMGEARTWACWIVRAYYLTAQPSVHSKPDRLFIPNLIVCWFQTWLYSTLRPTSAFSVLFLSLLFQLSLEWMMSCRDWTHPTCLAFVLNHSVINVYITYYTTRTPLLSHLSLLWFKTSVVDKIHSWNYKRLIDSKPHIASYAQRLPYFKPNSFHFKPSLFIWWWYNVFPLISNLTQPNSQRHSFHFKPNSSFDDFINQHTNCLSLLFILWFHHFTHQ